MIQNSTLLEILKKLDSRHDMRDHLFVLYGKVDQDMTVSTIGLIEKKMKLEGFNKSLITRTKMIAIEILQNIVKHQETHPDIYPYFILGCNKHELKILSGNVVTHNDKEIIVSKLEQFIALDEITIREKYKNAITSSELTPEGNAGIGLFDIVYRSNKNLTYQMEGITDDLYSFNLDVAIN